LSEIHSAETALCGIILHPAGHTRSPQMHNAAYRAMGVNAAYVAFDVAPEALAAAIEGMRALGLRQLSVSIPHKVAVMDLIDEVEETAQRIGAVNTITRDGDRLVGSNTDWSGAVRALERVCRLEGKRGVVLGAGGAARAVAFGLLESGAETHILNRTVERAKGLAEDLGATGAGPLEALADLEYDVLVNTTSVGLRSEHSPVPGELLRSGSVVMDAVYDPEETRLLRDAQAAGATALEGKWMLVYQAAEQLQRWTGKDAPIDVLEEAFDRAGSLPRIG
jgi:shikimate dehydrogenase